MLQISHLKTENNIYYSTRALERAKSFQIYGTPWVFRPSLLWLDNWEMPMHVNWLAFCINFTCSAMILIHSLENRQFPASSGRMAPSIIAIWRLKQAVVYDWRMFLYLPVSTPIVNGQFSEPYSNWLILISTFVRSLSRSAWIESFPKTLDTQYR